VAGDRAVSVLRHALSDYLSMRRALGFQLERSEKLLGQFIDYLEREGVETVRSEHALAWATQPEGVRPYWWTHRLKIVRVFTRYLATINPATEVPATDLLPHQSPRATPYLYSDEDVNALLAATGTLYTPLRRATHRTLLGLLSVTGMRVGEALALNREDVNMTDGLITIHKGKFNKSRENPLHPTSVAALSDYLRERDGLYPNPPNPALFLSGTGARLSYSVTQYTFQRLVNQAGLKPRSRTCRPRLHDFRHRVAINALLDAYRSGADVQARLTLVATYLGHVHPASTYWYLSAAPELLGLAGQRLERHLTSPS
jgi:integrase